jgi:Holliday junction resolvase
MVNSKEKGKKDEREWTELCREEGFTNARREQQYSGIEEEDKDILQMAKREVEIVA